MINDAKKLLPDFEVSYNAPVLKCMKLMPNGIWLTVPAIISDRKKLPEIAEIIKNTWEEQCLKY